MPQAPSRRQFLEKMGLGTLLISGGRFPWESLAEAGYTRLCILHTNDVHSRVEPFPMDGSKHQGLGGAARRAEAVARIRASEPNVLLLDAGDIFQGTPYFNAFGGELEFKLMSAMGYDAATLGNHDFDNGIEGLHRQLPHATFPFVNCNYDVRGTLLEGQVRPSIIVEKSGLRIGILGVGIELEGLVPSALCEGIRYADPIAAAQREATRLRKAQGCDYVIALSHLGHSYESGRVSDQVLAANTRHIDLIIGGHTHTFMERPDVLRNLDGQAVLVHQVGWAGIMLGRLDVYFSPSRHAECHTCHNLYLGKPE